MSDKKISYGLSLIEILIILAVIWVIVMIFAPINTRHNKPARSETCISNQRQIAAWLQMYAQDHEDYLPASRKIWKSIPFDSQILICPVTGKSLPNAYIFNDKLSNFKVEKIAEPDKIFLTVDGKTNNVGKEKYDNIYYSIYDVQYRHTNNIAVASFVDGHVLAIKNTDYVPWNTEIKIIDKKSNGDYKNKPPQGFKIIY